MNSDRLEGKWMQIRGSLRERWGKLTDDDLEQIQGQRDRLIGRIQERYGIARDKAEKEIAEFLREIDREEGEQRRQAS